ncbi:MAG: Rrf2 family transcriptional regulator [Acidobacteria bacterium]|nr:Rrf2 family transcriptional regulator [Acidobacteriota bacterium]
MLSAKAKYGLKALLSLAMEPQSRPALGAVIAAREDIPKKFLEQILLELKHRGLLQTKRGRHGGYLLTRDPAEITVGQIIRALDGPIAPIPCVSQSAYVKCDECKDETTCGIRLVMKQVRDAMARILDTATLADVVRMIAAASKPSDVVAPPASTKAKRPEPEGQTVHFRKLRGKLRR